MSTITRTATLGAATTDAGNVVRIDSGTATYETNPISPIIGQVVAGTTTVRFNWFQFNFNDLGDSDYDNAYIAANVSDVTATDFKYTIGSGLSTFTGTFAKIASGLPNGVTQVDAETLMTELESSTAYEAAGITVGAHTIDLNGSGSTVFADIKTAIQSIENDHNSATSDNGKWVFGGRGTGFVGSVANVIFSRPFLFNLDITYTVDIVGPTVTVVYSGLEAQLSLDDALSSTAAQWEFNGPEDTFTLETNATSGAIVNDDIEVVTSSLTTLNVVPKEFKAYSVRARQLIEGVWRDWGTAITVVSQKTKKLRPRAIYPALVDDSFGVVTLDDWTDASSVFKSNEIWLEATGTGSLAYSGTAINTLKTFNESTRANYLYSVIFLGKNNLKFTLLGRVSVTLNFADDTIELFDGDNVSLGKVSHALTHHKQYNLKLYSYEGNHLVLLNGGEILRKDWNGGYTDHTFSLRVDTVPSDGIAVFNRVSINELWNQVAPTKESTSDIVLDFRRSMIDEVDNTTDKSWRNWVKVRNIWRRGLNIGQPDETWTEWGYPIYEPSSEEWFVTTTTIS